MTVAQILKQKGSKVLTVEATDSVQHALEIMKERHIGALLVCGKGGKIEGVLSERDVVRALPEVGGKLLKSPVSSLMTKDVITCSPDHTVREVMEVMTEKRFRHLPVVKGGKLVGLISIGDAVKARISETEQEAEALKQYISSG